VQLATYADRLGGSLSGLLSVLEGPLAGLFSGVHVLPFYLPFDGADAGFDPQDHTSVDPRLGEWSDITALAAGREVMADLIVNHLSVESAQFRGFLHDGDDSPYAGMFLTMGTVFPDGATEEQLTSIYRPRPGLPLTPYVGADGGRRLVWTTFTDRQADVDVAHPASIAYLRSIVDVMAAHGVTTVRLDAVGYAVKKPGSTCFMLAETFDFIRELSGYAHGVGVEVLVEVHSYFQTQVDISKQVDHIYDFALPPLVLHALLNSDPDPLVRWMEVRPTNVVSVLDTHDGIGVIDVGPDPLDVGRPGLLTQAQIDALVEDIHRNTGGNSVLATGAAASNLDVYQVNSTFYDALGRNEPMYLLARAIQFFLPGVPQVYYVGLLGGANDMELLRRTGVGRDVNRHYYSRDELHRAIHTTVVQLLMRMIRFRNTHPAFSGEFTWDRPSPSHLVLRWTNAEHIAELHADFAAGTHTVHSTGDGPDLP
jgi:sucrose phosphorylase